MKTSSFPDCNILCVCDDGVPGDVHAALHMGHLRGVQFPLHCAVCPRSWWLQDNFWWFSGGILLAQAQHPAGLCCVARHLPPHLGLIVASCLVSFFLVFIFILCVCVFLRTIYIYLVVTCRKRVMLLVFVCAWTTYSSIVIRFVWESELSTVPIFLTARYFQLKLLSICSFNFVWHIVDVLSKNYLVKVIFMDLLWFA